MAGSFGLIPSQVRTKAGLPATHSVTWGETDNTKAEDEVERGKDGERMCICAALYAMCSCMILHLS